MTASNYACQRGHLKIVEMLVQKSAAFNIQINAKNDFGWTAFHAVCSNGHSEIAKLLIQVSFEFNINLNANLDVQLFICHVQMAN